jgi:hypothetical protein
MKMFLANDSLRFIMTLTMTDTLASFAPKPSTNHDDEHAYILQTDQTNKEHGHCEDNDGLINKTNWHGGPLN